MFAHGPRAVYRVRRFYSFLSLSWGIVADIDIESEAFRTCAQHYHIQQVANK
jgi:hypothetical protein